MRPSLCTPVNDCFERDFIAVGGHDCRISTVCLIRKVRRQGIRITYITHSRALAP